MAKRERWQSNRNKCIKREIERRERRIKRKTVRKENRVNRKNAWYKAVVLKSLTNSQGNTDFLDETAKHKDIDDWFNNIVPCYGLSQDPDTGNYLMVMQYMPEGNLRHYLSKNNRKLTLQNKLNQLVNISRGLKDIHSKSLVHRDFHSGNILKGIEKTSCLITDLGLCKPANETNDKKIFGVLPYVAPEVLLEKPYTQASDIYSFGIIAHEMLSGLPPYYDRELDAKLGFEICGRGLRPKFQIKMPQLLEELINRCWDADPEKRPTANKLERTLRKWQEELDVLEKSSSRDRKITEFTQQFQEAEEHNKTLPDNVKFPKYKERADYHSKLLPTMEITQLLKSFQLNKVSQPWSDSKQIDLEISANLDQQTEQTLEHQPQILHKDLPNFENN